MTESEYPVRTRTLEKKLPRPGSMDAVKDGCDCPIFNNPHGWIIHTKCPMHGDTCAECYMVEGHKLSCSVRSR